MAQGEDKNFTKFSTYRFDPRFPNVNQTRNCTLNFSNYHKCIDQWGLENEGCKQFKHAFQVMCNSKLLEEMKELVSNGAFHGVPDGRKRDEDGLIIQDEE